MTPESPRYFPLGERGITISFGDTVDRTLNTRVHRTAAAIRQASIPVIEEVVPAYAALTVFYDPLHIDYATLAERLQILLADQDAGTVTAGTGRDHRIPVRYDGPDLDEVARLTGLARREVIRRHAEPWYHVYLLGFVPGFAYLGDLDPLLVLSRRASPRKRVPAGSVAIAGAQTAIYPLDTPGGWQLIGQTDVVLFDPLGSPPSLLQPGDRVRFEPVDR